MKDLPHHIKKLNREVIRSAHREEMSEETYNATASSHKQTESEQKKISKRALTKERNERTPIHPSEEERNMQMRHRTPVFDRNNAKPHVTKPTRKKTPRI